MVTTIAIKDGTGSTIQTTAALDSDGNVTRNVNIEGRKATYSASTAAFTPAASATDIAEIKGSATKVIRILRVGISGYATSAAAAPLVLAKRSTANSGGTSAALTAVPNDSRDVAATAALLKYTANPTTGTLVGNVRGAMLNLGTATAPGAQLDFVFGDKNGKGIVLKDNTETLAINLAGASYSGNSVTVYFEWTEE
jgi:hypothetical protein